MHFNIRLKLTRSSLRELQEIIGHVMLAIVSFETKHRCLDSKPWSVTIIDRADDELFANLGEHDCVIWISERVETVPPKVIVSVEEDLSYRLDEAFYGIFNIPLPRK